MKEPPPLWQAARGDRRHKKSSKTHHRPSPASSQLAHRLRKLQHLRRDADAWCGAGSHGRPPQPNVYGLRLGELRSSEIYWRSS